MDDKRAWVAVIVSILFIAFYTETVLDPYLRPSRQQTLQTLSSSSGAAQSAATSAGTSESTPSSAGQQTASIPAAQNSWKPSLIAHPSTEQIAAAPKVPITTDEYDGVISTLGGRLVSLKLKKYKLHQNGAELVDLVSAGKDGVLPGGIYIGDSNDSFVQYTVENNPAHSISVKGSERAQISLVGTLNGDPIRKIFTFTGDSYLVNLEVTSGGNLAKQPSWLEWSHFLTAEASHARLNPVGLRTLSDESKVTATDSTSMEDGVSPVSPVQWISIDEKYFLTSLLPATKGPNGITIHETDAHGDFRMYARVSGSAGASTFGMYLGPKDSEILEATGYQLYRNIDLGFFSFLAFPMLFLLRFFYSIIGNYGLAIVLLTLLIKTVFLPLTMVSFRSARAMQALQPEIKALRERITDPTQLNQEMLGLYKKRGVNPMGGCFPVLIQIPVFIGLYNVLLIAIDLRHARFAMWIRDLSAPEQFLVFGFPIQLMVLILGVSMFVQQVLTPAPGMEPAQRKMLLAMPLVLTCSFLMYPLPAGLVLYWIVNNTISITQQIYVKSERKVAPLQATMIAGGAFLLVGYLLTLI